ncbi:hypothetical protein BP5796_08134 [Coleophoma crateriformis]|uniref:Box C/D snoRNA protein 1 n=1 Tax=Coleophoma crateriformis TaxID=565419 RepID=A0A3D8RDP8_9HELO|nr:hypothetical protein BP5796_08134 [Coleophoma crateriformis]
MADPLLSSLCRICNINLPKYTCPRCSLQTCSLACSRRHKIWKECNGIRDPTVYKPLSQVATPSGIDHDYNFLHGIEHKIERAEKEIIDDRGLLDRRDLQAARAGRERVGRGERRKMDRGQECIRERLQQMGTRVERAPQGMKRSLDNGTSWSKKGRCIYWQVEWVSEGETRALGRVSDREPLGKAYAAFLEEERRLKMSGEEKKIYKKRKATELKEREAKRVKLDESARLAMMGSTVLQDPSTSTWSLTTTLQPTSNSASTLTAAPTEQQRHTFYLLRPHTPSTFPKVLIPLSGTQPLLKSLEKRTLLEFPTIYVFTNSDSGAEHDLPEEYMLEGVFCAATGLKAPSGFEARQKGQEDESDSDSEEDEAGLGSDSGTSSGEDSDEEMEEGEIS